MTADVSIECSRNLAEAALFIITACGDFALVTSFTSLTAVCGVHMDRVEFDDIVQVSVAI